MEYWRVTDDGDEEIELPSEEDRTLLLTTLAAQFPGASGLKYKIKESASFRGIRLADGKLHPPEDSISHITFHCVFPKDGKRKNEEDDLGPLRKKGPDVLKKAKCSDLIILGLPYRTTEDDVRTYFEQYGDLLLVQVKKNPQTGRSKGFGFVRFRDIESQAKVICKRHVIDGRWCEVKIAGHKDDNMNVLTTKVFVGRLPDNITETDLNEYFSQYGQVLDVYIPKPFRGFGFINFADPYVAYQICNEDHIINQTSVHVTKAAPRGSKSASPSSNYMGPGGGFPNGSESSYRGGGGNTSGGPSSSGYRSHEPKSGGGGGKDLTGLLAAALNQAGISNILNQLAHQDSSGPRGSSDRYDRGSSYSSNYRNNMEDDYYDLKDKRDWMDSSMRDDKSYY